MLYILHGPEPYSRKEAFEKLKASLDTDGSLSTNTTTFDGTKTTPQEVIAACDTVPFLGGGRLVVIEGLLKAAGRGKKRAASRSRTPAPVEPGDDAEANVGAWSALVDYVPRLPETTTLVLIDDEAPATGLIAGLKPYATIEEFKRPDEKQMAGFVMNRAKQTGIKIDVPAAKLLGELIGNDVWMLTNEMDKLAAYAGNDVIREADVSTLVSRAKEHKGYELSDAVASGQGAKAAKLIQELVEDGQACGVLLSNVVGRYRRIAITKAMHDSGASGSAIASRLNMKIGYGLDKLLEQAERLTWSDIRRAYALAVQSELDHKRGIMEEQLALELYAQAMAAPKRPAATASRP